MKQNKEIPAGYKDSLLGIIPEEWEVNELEDFVKLSKSKYTPNSKETFRCIELEHICQYDGEILGWVNSSDQRSIKNKFVKGQILFGKLRPYLNKYWLAKFDGVCSSEIWVLHTSNKKCINEYLYRIVQSDNFIREANISSGSKMPRADWDYVSSCFFLLPPITEQEKIVKILGIWDITIEKQKILIEKLERRKLGLMQTLLTGEKRLKGFSEEWKKIHISDASKEVSIKNKDDKALTVLSCTKYNGLVPSLEYFGRKIFSDDLSTYKVVPKNHFAYATNHIEEGSIGYQDKFDEALISPMYTVFKTDSKVNDNFFFNLLKSYRCVYDYQTRMEGSIDRRGGLRWDAFSIIKISLPSIKEQTAIAEVLTTADQEINSAKARLNSLIIQKKGLMQQLLTGKTRVKL